LNEKVERDYPRSLIVLTDGAIANKEETIRLIERFREDVTLHSLGIIGADRGLVESIAVAGNGKFAFTDNRDIDRRTIEIASGSLDIFFREVRLNIPDNYKQLPEQVSPVRIGRRLLVFANTEKAQDNQNFDNLSIQYKDPLGIIQTLLIEKTRVVHTNFLSKLAALQRIRELECIETDREPEDIEDEITRLGITYQLATEYTAFVAVHENSEETQTLESMKNESVNNESVNNVSFDDWEQEERKCVEKDSKKKKEEVNIKQSSSKNEKKKKSRVMSKKRRHEKCDEV